MNTDDRRPRPTRRTIHPDLAAPHPSSRHPDPDRRDPTAPPPSRASVFIGVHPCQKTPRSPPPAPRPDARTPPRPHRPRRTHGHRVMAREGGPSMISCGGISKVVGGVPSHAMTGGDSDRSLPTPLGIISDDVDNDRSPVTSVMAGAGPPPTALLIPSQEIMDGAPSPAMTGGAVNEPTSTPSGISPRRNERGSPRPDAPTRPPAPAERCRG